MRSTRILALVAVALAASSVAPAEDIHVVVSGGFAAAYKTLAATFETRTHNHLVTERGASMGQTTTAIPARLDRGEAVDVIILAREGLDPLFAKGQVDPASVVDLVRSKIAMAVRQGAPVPDISSVAAFKRTLLEAKSVAYSDSTSGVYLSGTLFKRLGIEQEMLAKGRMIPGTPVGETVARGEAEIGFQQYSELLPVAGIRLVGAIPEETQMVTVYAAAITTRAHAPAAARALIQFLSSPEAREAIKASGLEPVDHAGADKVPQ
jgi:molybdate transport system substrate-binding protein